MTRILISLIILFLAIYLGLQLNHDPGNVFISVNDWTVETTLWFGILTLLVSFFIIHELLRLFTWIYQIPMKYHIWKIKHDNQVAQEKTRQGLIEFSEGYWATAKNHLLKALPNAETPLLNYLTAARAAQEMGEPALRDDYLREAQQAMPEAQIAVELTQAQLQLANKQWEQALATLRHLQDIAPKHPYVLKLLMILYQEIQDWKALITLLPLLKKNSILPQPEWNKLFEKAYLNAFNKLIETNQQEKISEFFQSLPRKLGYQTEVVAAYSRYLISTQQTAKAECLLKNSLKKQFDPELITLYGLLPDAAEALKFAESLLKNHANSAELLLCLARLSFKQQLWGNCKSYLEQSLRLKSSAAAYAELGLLHETLHEPVEACLAYRTGLHLNLQTEP